MKQMKWLRQHQAPQSSGVIQPATHRPPVPRPARVGREPLTGIKGGRGAPASLEEAQGSTISPGRMVSWGSGALSRWDWCTVAR